MGVEIDCSVLCVLNDLKLYINKSTKKNIFKDKIMI